MDSYKEGGWFKKKIKIKLMLSIEKAMAAHCEQLLR